MDINTLGQMNQYTVDQARLVQAGQKMEQAKQAFLNPNSNDEKKLRETAQDFESIFMKQLLDAMDKTVDRTDSIMNGGTAEEYFRDMMNDEIAKGMSHRVGGSGLGLAEAIYKQMAGQTKTVNTLKMPEGPVIGKE